ncbi:hypothetical protein Tco_0503812 [Tanacetum coccineum]
MITTNSRIGGKKPSGLMLPRILEIVPCVKVVFPKYLDDDIPPFVRRLFLENLKKLEKNKAGLEEAAKDKAAKGKAAQPSDKGDKVSVTIRDLCELVQKEAKWKKLSFDDSVRCLFGYWNRSPTVITGGLENQKGYPDSNPTTKLQPTDAEMGHNWYRKSYDCFDDGCGATDGAKVSGEAMNDADMSAVAHVE